MALRDQLSFQLSVKNNETLFGALYDKNEPTTYSTKDLIEAKNIEAKINNILLSLDLEKRIDLSKKIVQDIFKTDFKSEIKNNFIDFKNLNDQINIEKEVLEKLYNFSNEYKFN